MGVAVLEPPAAAASISGTGVADRHTPMIRDCWYVAAQTDEVTRTPMHRWLLGRDVLLYRKEDGQAVALQNRCAHRSFPLHEGRLEGDAIVCNYHGLTYGPEGRCVRVPADDREAARRLAKLHAYPLVERGPLLWIWPGDPERADESQIPDTPWLADAGWAHAGGYKHITANYVGLHENLLDTTHFGYLHAGNVGTPEYAMAPADFEQVGDQVRIKRVQRSGVLPSLYDGPMGLVGVAVERHTDSWYVSPGWHAAHAKVIGPDGIVRRTEILHGITPETLGRTHYFWFIARDYAVDDPSVTAEQHDAIVEAFEEDRLALEWIEEIAAREDRTFREISIMSDRAGVRMRQLIARQAAGERDAA